MTFEEGCVWGAAIVAWGEAVRQREIWRYQQAMQRLNGMYRLLGRK